MRRAFHPGAAMILALALFRPAAWGQDTSDPLTAARALKAGITPLAPGSAGLTRDVGQIAVIEHDGSNYDKGNLEARAAVAQRFYQTHGDNYDFLVVFTNFEFETGTAIAFHNSVRNSVRGIGLAQFDNGALFQAPGRLTAFVDMADVSRYRRAPQSLSPASPGLVRTLNVLAHEVGHQWLSHVRYRDAAGATSSALLGKDGAHWSYLLDSDASVMYGADWQARQDGTFVAAGVDQGYSALDLYLMGLLDPAAVPPFVLLRNPAIDATRIAEEGDVVSAQPETVSIAQVIAAEGERSPSFLLSPKAFRVGFVFLTAPGVEPDPADLEAVDLVRRMFPGHFFALTRGVAIADTTLAEGPPVAQAPFPDLDRAVAWLLEKQSIDGRFEDSAYTTVRDTAAALDALAAAGVVGTPSQRVLQFLATAAEPSLDAAARRATALGPSLDAAARAQAEARLLALQNPDGGFGAARGFTSDALDTALALRALHALGSAPQAPVRAALGALRGLAAIGGGWAVVPGAPVSTVATAHALLALLDWKDQPESAAPTAAGLAALLARQNPDGGFGESPSTPYATALALETLVRGGAGRDATDAAIGWLQRTQQPDGSWGGARYPTALVLGALKGGVRPNLLVPADAITFLPPQVREGEPVTVVARVENTGRSEAGASRARLYDGPVESGDLLGEADVPPLAAGESATIEFRVATSDRAGARTLTVVADALNQVAEGREDDNATSRVLQVEGLLPDLAILPGDLSAVPAPAETGEVVAVSARVTNTGTKRAPPSRVRFFDGAPATGGTLVAEAPLGALEPGASAVVAIPWLAPGEPAEHFLFAVADATYSVHESDETNNLASVTVAVAGPLPAGPDLELAALSVTPSRLEILPQDVMVRAVVRNLGRDAARSSVRLVSEPEAGVAPVELAVEIPGRSSLVLVVPLRIASGGSRSLIATADPDDTLAETREDNNRAVAVLEDPADTLDVEILPSDVAVSARELVAGETLRVSVRVRNRGTAPLTQVPVVLSVGVPPGQSELARRLVSLEPGAETELSLEWLASIVGDSVPLFVRADPFDLLRERDEANNAVPIPVRVVVSSLPDLVALGGDTSFEPDPPREGAPAIVRVHVRNPTPVAAGPFNVVAYLGVPDVDATAVRLGSTRVAGLGPNADTQVGVEWPSVAVRGAQGIFVSVDADDEVAEFDERNNTGFRAFGILGLPDLVLTAGGVTLQPAFPRAGESVEVRASVRNLGGQTAAPVRVRMLEGEGEGAVVVGEQAIASLAPGATGDVSFAWTPAPPAGERTLSLLVDPDDAVREQNEGNNLARLSVLVQDADLFLTAPYFSPNGDGVQDDTTLGYRATGEVRVVVSNAHGLRVRTLAEHAPAQGTLVWDGRGEDGRLLPDGRYTISVEGEGRVVLGRVLAVVDTDRSAIHEAAGTGLIAVQQLTSRIPEVAEQIAWLPAEDEALMIVPEEQGDFPAGLIRVATDGSHVYVARDEWYDGNVEFVGPGAVSPDGREVLLRRRFVGDPNLYAVDLSDGSRRVLASDATDAWWSPDGRFLATRGAVLTRDGDVVAALPTAPAFGAAWAWSPDGRMLALGNTIVERDSGEVRTIPIPDGLIVGSTPVATTWRGDGTIHAVFARVVPLRPAAPRAGRAPPGSATASTAGRCGFCFDVRAVTIDPATGQVAAHPVTDGQWSPDASRVLYASDGQTFVAAQDASGAFPLVAVEAQASPRSTVASYACAGCTPGAGFELEHFVVRNLLNLTAELRAVRLPGDDGVLLAGIVSDRNLDHYQLDYAEQSDPETWRPIGAASEVPVIDDALAVWAPPRPGSYLLRLRAFDRAGNRTERVQAVAWDRTPVLADLTQDEFLISPNGDGVKDAVTFRYLVQQPARVALRIVGPGPEGPTVRTGGLEYPAIGPASFSWDGRDGAGRVVPDGRYTVYLNELPLRVEVDTTPPDIAWANQNLRSVVLKQPECGSSAAVPVGAMVADRLMHVVDAHLRRWSGPGAAGSEPVFEPERDADGRVVFDGVVPRVRRVAGRVVDRLEQIGGSDFARPAELVAEDYAGNRSVVPIVPLPERLFVLEGDPGDRCQAIDGGLARILPPVVPTSVYLLRPTSEFVLGVARRDDVNPVRFQYRLRAGGAWTETPLRGFSNVDFLALGLAVGTDYQGRFAMRSGLADIYSEEFGFSLCDEFALLEVMPSPEPVPGTTLRHYGLTLHHRLARPPRSATIGLSGRFKLGGYSQQVTLAAVDDHTLAASVLAPDIADGCPSSARVGLAFQARLIGYDGRSYADDGVCVKLGVAIPESSLSLSIEPDPKAFCGSPDRLPLLVSGSGPAGARVAIERGPDDPMVLLGEAALGSRSSPTRFEADVTGVGEGDVTIRGRIQAPGNPDTRGCPTDERTFFVDRTPPEGFVLQPAEGASLCAQPDPRDGREIARVVVSGADRSKLGVVATEYRHEAGPWRAFAASCLGGAQACAQFPEFKIGTALPLGWDVTGLPQGEYTLRFTFCDGAGNRTVVERHTRLQREPPHLSLRDVEHAVFSPNGDGRFDTATATLELSESVRLSATVRAGSSGGPLVRTLLQGQTTSAGLRPVDWDGRDDRGAVAADGEYVLVVSAADACGRAASLGVPLTLDATAPAARIVEPTAAGSILAPSLDVRGVAADEHFASYELSFGEGPAPSQWTVLAQRTTAATPPEPPAPFAVLGRWDTPAVGPYTLRLLVTDAALNQAESRVTVEVAPRRYLGRLSASPSPFSPNGDGRLDSARLEYELTAAAVVWLRVVDTSGAILKTFETGARHDPGVFGHDWSGLGDLGTPVPDGDLALVVHLEDALGIGEPQDASIDLTVDRQTPEIVLTEPLAGSVTSRTGSVRGSILDRTLGSYTVDGATGAEPLRRLAQGAVERRDAALAPLASLEDGPARIVVSARDAAGNETTREVGFVLDSVPPSVSLRAPAGVVASESGPYPVRGGVEDAHPLDWQLDFGPGEGPGAFVEIAHAVTAGPDFELARWDVAALPDGPYTLRLRAHDQAGLGNEARVIAILDGTPPLARIDLPAEAAWLSRDVDVVGVAADANIDSWRLEAAPGSASSAFQWTTLAEGTAGIQGAAFVRWQVPADGHQMLRLTVRDRAGHTAVALRGVGVDSSPPSPPRGLRAEVAKRPAGGADVSLVWDAASEADVTGYRVLRDASLVADGLATPAYRDLARPEGTFEYSVVAVDRAGNQSAAARLVVRVDVTPPLAALLAPAGGAAVSGLVTVRGTAFSPEDFKEYRLLVGAGAAPAAFTLLARSSVPVVAGRLGAWVAAGGGPHLIVLEAEDDSGNVARASVSVVVDTDAPEPPVLTSLEPGARPDALVATWQPSASGDVTGYIVERDGRIANAPGVVLGDVRGYLVAGPRYEDEGLPDGTRCYAIRAIDEAGNSSQPSNLLCRSLDNRPPHATLVEPPDGLRFEHPIRVAALTPDTDVVSVQFQVKPALEEGWQDLGPADTARPFETTFDPSGRAFGAYDLRAVATDQAGATDPVPASVRVRHADTTAPAPPLGLLATVRGGEVVLAWARNGEADLAGYAVHRDGERLTPDLLASAGFTDTGLSPGEYRYEVVAVDADGNESGPASVGVVVYRLSLDPPFPAGIEPTVALTGDGARPGVVRILRDGVAIASAATAGGTFRVDTVPLAAGLNLLRAVGSDAAGNESLASDEVVRIAHDPPAALAGLATSLDGRDGLLTWEAATGADVFGYVVERDGQRLTASSPQTEADDVSASDGSASPEQAFDRDPATGWVPTELPVTWTVHFPEPVLVDRVVLRFQQDLPGVFSAYRLEALWQDRFVPLALVTGNTEREVVHGLPTAFATDTLQVVATAATAAAALAELDVRKLDAVPAGSPSFRDPIVPDGTHAYAVASIDRYGALGPAATGELSLPVVPPAPPVGLVALVTGRDVALAWDASPEPDVVAYAILRDGVRVAVAATPTHHDLGLANGSYIYTVLAIDSSGQESAPSAPALAVVTAPSDAPAAPEIVFPATPGHPATLASAISDVRGFADAGSLVTLEVDGAYAGTTLAQACSAAFVDAARVAPPGPSWSAVVSRDGARAVFNWYEPDTGESRLTLVETRSGAASDLTPADAGATELRGSRLISATAGLAYVAFTAEAPAGGLYLVDLDTRARRLIDATADWHSEQAFSDDGTRLAYAFSSGAELRIGVHETAAGTSRVAYATTSAIALYGLRWSPDGERLSFVELSAGPEPPALRILDLATGAVTTVDEDVGPASWSPDASRLAYSRNDGTALLRELASGTVTELGPGSEPQFDPEGTSVVLIGFESSGTSAVVQDLATGERRTAVVLPYPSGFAPAPRWLADGALVLGVPDGLRFLRGCSRGTFEVGGVVLRPGVNTLVARALDPAVFLASPDSLPVVIDVPEASFADLELTAADLQAYPALPLVGQETQLAVRVRNVGAAAALSVPVTLGVHGPDGTPVLEREATLARINGGAAASFSVSFVPTQAGAHTLFAAADPRGSVVETREDNNSAARLLNVAASPALIASVAADRASYPARSPLAIQVGIVNPGPSLAGSARLAVLGATGGEVALVDQRGLSLDYGAKVAYSAGWNTANTYAGDYTLQLRVADSIGAPRAAAEWRFRIEPELLATARLVPESARVTAGTRTSFRARIENAGANAPLVGHTAAFRVVSAGVTAFEQTTALPAVLPGGAIETSFEWPSAGPASSCVAELRVLAPDGSERARALAPFVVVAPPAELLGRLALLPSQVLAGDPVTARLQLTNPAGMPMLGVPVSVQVMDGAGATTLVASSAVVDLAPGETRELDLALATAGLSPRAYPVFLRSGARSLARTGLGVHAALGAPSVDAPADGAVVATARPTLVVNNAVAPPGATLRYEFELFADPALQQALPGTTGVAEGVSRTSWTVFTALAEDRMFFWRARASDGFSTSPWTSVASFTVDERNLPPSSPSLDSPAPESTVATRQPRLSVRNAFDPELAHLSYEFRLARDPEMSAVVAQASGIAETFGVTSWTPGLLLDEDARYYWSARASDGVSFSPWSDPAAFLVDSENGPPTAPEPLEPVSLSVATTSPRLVVRNARDPEGLPLRYRFEIDRVPSFESPERQASPELAEEPDVTGWTPALPLADNATHYWRASASDGVSSGPWALARFFVNLANDPPSTPVPVSPGDGQIVATDRPLLRVRNAVDLDGDPLTYDFRVSDAAGVPAASVEAVPEAPLETAWQVDVALVENGRYLWSARARDATSASAWSAPQSFRVNAVAEQPTAPTLVSPPDGATLGERRPTLTVQNATSPDGLPLTYGFEIYAEGPAGATLVASVTAVGEGPGTTSFTARTDLADGPYSWRARADDGRQPGPWLASARFAVAVDVPPAPPTGLAAVPGDGRVQLTWHPSPEPDVTSYRVYRAPASGGPYALAGETASATFVDAGRVNGTTLYYVVTALDARFESAASAEVAATPQAAGAVAAEVRFAPSTVAAACLFGERRPSHTSDVAEAGKASHDGDGDDCPEQLIASIELAAGDPSTIEVASVRLAGSVAALRAEAVLRDDDHDGLLERRVVFRFEDVAPLLAGGPNRLRVSGRFSGGVFAGEGRLDVGPLALDLKLTPESLVRRAPGGDVRAHLDLDRGLRGSDVDLASLRLQDQVPVKRVVKVSDKEVMVDFDRAQLLALLPNGPRVTVTLSGRVGRVGFEARDTVKVKD